MKLQIAAQLCLKFVMFTAILLGLLNMCMAAPLESYYPTEDNEDVSMLTNPQRLQLLKDLREMITIEDKNKQAAELKSSYAIENEPTGLWRVMPQKRFRPFRTQTRAGNGGVALCLWKVCPAAPWLVSRRR